MKVVEKFISINGEGTRAGELSVFIRFKGCNLNCSYCDTAWANTTECTFEEMLPTEIYNYIKDTRVKNITLTGGEPLLQSDMGELLEILNNDGEIRVEVETNGAVSLRPFCNVTRPYFTMDYKLPSSGCESKMDLDNFSLLELDDTVKFVVGSKEDLEKAKNIIDDYSSSEKCNVLLSPVFGKIEPVEIVEFLKSNVLNGIKLQLQMHKMIWEPNQKGV